MASCSEFSHWLKKTLLAQAGLPPCFITRWTFSNILGPCHQHMCSRGQNPCYWSWCSGRALGEAASQYLWDEQITKPSPAPLLNSPSPHGLPLGSTQTHWACLPPASSPMSFPLAWNTSNHTTRSPSLQVLPVNFIKKSIEKIKVTLKKRILLRA